MVVPYHWIEAEKKKHHSILQGKNLSIQVFSNVRLCRLASSSRRFEGSRFIKQSKKKNAPQSFEKSQTTYQNLASLKENLLPKRLSAWETKLYTTM
jgi:hypothetical protein